MKMAMKAVREQGTTQMEEELKVLREKLQQERARHLVSKELSQHCCFYHFSVHMFVYA